jgi:hypothetical protein
MLYPYETGTHASFEPLSAKFGSTSKRHKTSKKHFQLLSKILLSIVLDENQIKAKCTSCVKYTACSLKRINAAELKTEEST